MEETQIFEFDKVQTASPKIAEAYIYLKQLDAATEVSQGDDWERLTSKLGAVFGLAARIKACLCDYLGLEYAEEAVSGTLASEIFSLGVTVFWGNPSTFWILHFLRLIFRAFVLSFSRRIKSILSLFIPQTQK